MRIVLFIVALGAAFAAAAADEVYRWTDKDGVVHYGSQPPSKDAKPAALPELQTYRPGTKVPLTALETPKPAPAVAIQEVRVLAPVQDEIFRDPAGIVNVSVAVLPSLPAGAGVIFYLDGAPKNSKPLLTTSTTFTSVERGEHSVTAAVVDATGKELKRAPAVVFHARPPGGLKP